MTDSDLYEAIVGLLAALKPLQAALEKEAEEERAPLAVVAGQDCGSETPKANLKSVRGSS